MTQRLVARINSLVFVGEPLGERRNLRHLNKALIICTASNQEYLRAALEYPMDVFTTSEVIRLLPSFFSW
jgi:hypothetical protein